jgi:hypothetical protein
VGIPDVISLSAKIYLRNSVRNFGRKTFLVGNMDHM